MGRIPEVPVIIDVDTGIDDIIALSAALKSEKLHVLGITTVAGNQSLDMTTRNTLNALTLMGREDIPVAAGASKPLERPLRDAGHIHGDNGLGGYRFPVEGRKKPVAAPAWDFIRTLLLSAPEPVTIIALAPLTNIAILLRDFPEVKGRIERIVFMGGSIRAGNPTPVATFNVLCDPEAARFVLKAGVPFTMCSLECTRTSFLTPQDLAEVRSIRNPVAEMVGTVTDFYRTRCAAERIHLLHPDSLAIHDLCTIAAVTHPGLFEGERYYADVETKGELTTGFTLVDYENNLKKRDEERNVLFLVRVEREPFVRNYIETLKRY